MIRLSIDVGIGDSATQKTEITKLDLIEFGKGEYCGTNWTSEKIFQTERIMGTKGF